MAQQQVNLSDEELLAAQHSGLFDDPAVLNRLDSDSRRRLSKIQAPPAPTDNPVADSGPVTRFVGGVAQSLNPVPFAKSMRTEGPIQTAKNLYEAQMQQFDQAGRDLQQGHYTEGVGHLTAGTVPIIGPAAAHAADTIKSGDIAAGIGQGVGLAAPFIAGPAIEGARKVSDVTGASARIAGAAERGATQRFVDATAPKLGQNKLRLNNIAADVAPDVLRNTTANTRTGLQTQVEAKLDEATQGLDAAADARGPTLSMSTRPILTALRQERQRLVAETIDGSQVIPDYSESNVPTAIPIGKDVIPGPNQGQVALIDKAIKEVEQLGSVARYEAIRRIRQAYDQLARIKYSPAVTPDFLAKQGEASAAARVTGVLRDKLATASPETAAANTDYALYKSAHDVLQATEETERARPTVGRTIMARAAGAAAGGEVAGGKGIIAGAIIGPLVEKILTETKPAMKIIMARRLNELADALRRNQPDRAQSLTSKLVAQFPNLVKTMPKAANLTALPTAADNQREPPTP